MVYSKCLNIPTTIIMFYNLYEVICEINNCNLKYNHCIYSQTRYKSEYSKIYSGIPRYWSNPTFDVPLLFTSSSKCDCLGTGGESL